ncbi:transcriptional regulator, MarR family [Schinkia azotoformans MEV2011]|uniref:Transcriptional regulator, MarR family n=1 Tax=Schinkia azotoformans MEV2011 TaxID=1348973 RepID=A0A072NZM5_SCHAZ|nr:MarR family transcriptional regulator [Schinkia azotoformans]KEF38685.1 transcriptional regulator, MarR family [Schinkia azotoformans MEV2011]MEC1696889.1 MarR family transcriptional regulator [Schinkia azotoformans]MEC1717860.1 MarR family transcriptional regulator [Schinkia azotoformans]MEC1727228.1 MarR family transcriptional regulator [Schinkia azotoformans]MEC1739709.1 MarR family transcriptional regulator [Schinkia azotoformans]
MREFPSKFKGESSESIGFLFIRVYNIWHREIKRKLRELNLTHPQFVVLTTLGYLSKSHKDINQALIAKEADMDVMTVSSIVKKLEQSELIVRSTSERDPRANTLCLTKSGQVKLEIAVPLVERIDDIFFSSLGVEEELFKKQLSSLSSFDFNPVEEKHE